MIVNELHYPSFKNHELILDLNLQAFSIYDISGTRDDQTPGLVDYIIYPEHSRIEIEEPVTDSTGVLVLDANGVVVTVTSDQIAINEFKPREEVVTFLYLYQEVTGSGYTFWGFSRYLNTFSRDWDNLTAGSNQLTYGYQYPAYMITGYNLTGDMARQGQSIYLQTFCKRTEYFYTYSETEYDHPSACWVSGRWEWNNSNFQGKWSDSFNAYRFTKPLPSGVWWYGVSFDYGDTVITTKNKLRGRGHALSILFEAEPGKDLRLLGWNALMTKNGEP